MLNRILSADLPRSRWLTLLLVLLVAALALTPFIFPGVKALNVAAKVLVFIVLVASFDLLLGYTGIVSFAHTMFFGIGAYGIAIATTVMGPTWAALAVGLGGALVLSFWLALLVGLFSLRVRAIFFAMITLAVASARNSFSRMACSTRPNGELTMRSSARNSTTATSNSK
jgi:branched-chain amino acid transport system permease protein